MIAVVWLLLMVVAFYFLLVRPQRRQMQTVRALQASLLEGDDVVTTSGIHGRILVLHDTTVELEIAPGTTITLSRGAIGQRVTDTPVDGRDRPVEPGEDGGPVSGGD